jgi:hypothetical protein
MIQFITILLAVVAMFWVLSIHNDVYCRTPVNELFEKNKRRLGEDNELF